VDADRHSHCGGALSSSALISRIPTRRASSRASAIGNRDWRLGSCCRRTQIRDLAATHYAPAVFQRVLADFFAVSLHFCSGSAAARDLPPFAPPSCPRLTAAESLPCSSGVGGPLSTCPVVMSPTSLSAWETSLGCLARLRFVAPPSLSYRWREFRLGLCWSYLGRLSGMSANMRRPALAESPKTIVSN
jgi:hypothetical protein